MLSVEDAQDRVLAHARTMAAQTLDLRQACWRVLAEDIHARHSQPPFAASAMDGYAVRWEDIAALPARLRLIGTSAAGARFEGRCGAGEAVRIFTGAPLPEGADSVVVQEEAQPDGAHVRITGRPEGRSGHVRPAGIDFGAGDLLLRRGCRLSDRDIALAASANHARLSVFSRPRVALLTTGDELRPPGQDLGPDQIVASNSIAIALLLEAAGAIVDDLGIVPDDLGAITRAFGEASKADIVVTIGGASVGERDLIRAALEAGGARLAFWKIAMRPGKPLLMAELAGGNFAVPVLGLPGNPVSAMVCARLFAVPLVRAMQGMAPADCLPALHAGTLIKALPANGPRTHYLRARVHEEAGRMWVTPFADQDSSLLRILSAANALAIRPADAPAIEAEAPIHYIWL